MILRVRFAFDDDQLRAIRQQLGHDRPATRAEVESWIQDLVHETLSDLVSEWEAEKGSA